jgi:hypothetical protein
MAGHERKISSAVVREDGSDLTPLDPSFRACVHGAFERRDSTRLLGICSPAIA